MIVPGIRVGTSGWSFADWVGPFYPPGTRAPDFLAHYARHFDSVEVNVTYYRVPPPSTFERMVAKTPPGFHFVVKLHREITHERSRDPEVYARLLRAIEPLKRADRYDGLLAQFPWGFRRTPEHRRHLRFVREQLPGEPLFAEFRHDSWLTPGLEPGLREHGIGFCAVDEPALPHLMPPVTLLTTPDAYVRFHGRNGANWWGRGGGDRYDYDYREDELREWVRKIADLAQKARATYLFFNNCHAGQAARSAKLMQELLRQQKLLP